jgi:hypothetical protein
MLAAAALVEMFIVTKLVRGGGVRSCLLGVLWSGGLFGTYRLLLRMIGYTGPCMCLGDGSLTFSIVKAFPRADSLLSAFVAYMLLGALFLLLLTAERRAARAH